MPYVYQGGVEHYAWLTAPQMRDGLALGETTPGPLIMIVAFVGFCGWLDERDFRAGRAITGMEWFVPVSRPCLLFCHLFCSYSLVGPAVEATRGDVKFTAPLSGITAAVVGVIINLAVFFAFHVLWPEGFKGTFEWYAALIGILAFIALFRFKLGIVDSDCW